MLTASREEGDEGENVEVGWFFAKCGSSVLYYTKHYNCMQDLTEAGNNLRPLSVFPYQLGIITNLTFYLKLSVETN